MGKSYKAEKSFSHLEDGNNRSASRKSSGGKGSKMAHNRRASSYFDDNESLSSLDSIVPARFLNKLTH
jgi:hypothetical protein